jgi:hypothetical protein
VVVHEVWHRLGAGMVVRACRCACLELWMKTQSVMVQGGVGRTLNGAKLVRLLVLPGLNMALWVAGYAAVRINAEADAGRWVYPGLSVLSVVVGLLFLADVLGTPWSGPVSKNPAKGIAQASLGLSAIQVVLILVCMYWIV